MTDPVEKLSALAHAERLSAFRALVPFGETGLSVGEVAARQETTDATASARLAVLARAGLVTRRREGKRVHYTCDFDALRDLVQFLLEDCCREAPSRVEPFLDSLQACGPPDQRRV